MQKTIAGCAYNATFPNLPVALLDTERHKNKRPSSHTPHCWVTIVPPVRLHTVYCDCDTSINSVDIFLHSVQRPADVRVLADLQKKKEGLISPKIFI